MTGVTPKDVERFFHQSRARREKRVDPGQEHLNRVVLERALREQAERARAAVELEALELVADQAAYERSID